MQVHHEPLITPTLGGVHERLGELVAKLNVVRAAAPLPVDATGPVIVPIVASARLDLACETQVNEMKNNFNNLQANMDLCCAVTIGCMDSPRHGMAWQRTHKCD